MKKVYVSSLVMLLLASAVTLAVMPASAAGMSEQYKELFEGDNKITRGELASAICSYMLGGGALQIEELRDAAHVYAYWNGKPRTITDSAKRTVTIYKPLRRMVVLNTDFLEAIVVLNASERVVGVSETIRRSTRFFPELSKLDNVGKWNKPDIEAIIALNPDAVGAFARSPKPEYLEDNLPPTITVIRLDYFKAGTLREEMKELGYLLNEEDNAKRYLEWHDKYVESIKEKVSGIPAENRTRVFIESGGGRVFGRRAFSTGTGMHDLVVVAGGINIAEGHVERYADVATEWILTQRPDVIVGISFRGGYETDDCPELKADFEEIMALPGFKETVPAVINKRVHIISNAFAFAPQYPAALATMAEWLYPDLFELDPRAIQQEYIDKFMGIDYNVYEQGVFVYPEAEPS